MRITHTTRRIRSRWVRRRGLPRVSRSIFFVAGGTRLLMRHLVNGILWTQLIYESHKLLSIVASSRAHTDIVREILLLQETVSA